MKFVLASASASRKKLLAEIGFVPDQLLPTDIDETPKKKEKPRLLAARLAQEKGERALALLEDKTDVVILSGDTVVSVGARVVDKALNDDGVRRNMERLSGRNHMVFSAFNVIRTDEKGEVVKKIAKVGFSRVKFKHLSKLDVDHLVASKTGVGVAGGYTINNLGGSFVISMVGTPSNIMGMPIYMVRNALLTVGLKPSLFVNDNE